MLVINWLFATFLCMIILPSKVFWKEQQFLEKERFWILEYDANICFLHYFHGPPSFWWQTDTEKVQKNTNSKLESICFCQKLVKCEIWNWPKKGIFLEDHKSSQFAKLFSSPLRWQHERMLNKGRELQHQLKLFRISFQDKYFLKEVLLVCLFICIYPPISSPSGGFSPMIFASIWDVCHNVSPTHKAVWFNTNTQSCVSTAIFKVNKQDTGKPQALSPRQTPNC